MKWASFSRIKSLVCDKDNQHSNPLTSADENMYIYQLVRGTVKLILDHTQIFLTFHSGPFT